MNRSPIISAMFFHQPSTSAAEFAISTDCCQIGSAPSQALIFLRWSIRPGGASAIPGFIYKAYCGERLPFYEKSSMLFSPSA